MKQINTGIYFEKSLQMVMSAYLKALNTHLEKEGQSDVDQQTFTNKIVKRFLYGNEIYQTTFDQLFEKAETLNELGETLLQIVYQEVPLKSLLNQKYCCQELVLDVDLYKDLTKASTFIYSENEGARITLVNQLFKTWFIKKTAVTSSTFLQNKTQISEIVFDEQAFQDGYLVLDSYFAKR